MATTIRIPVDLRAPDDSGNAFWTVTALTAWNAGHWEFVKDVEGYVYGVVAVPQNVAATPNAKVVLSIAANATSGVASLAVLTKAVADGESLDPAALTAETTQDVTVPATARLRDDVTFPAAGALGEAVAAGDLLLVAVFHDGDKAEDTLAVNLELYAAFFEIDIE